ncbi:MAG: hypothetical protein J6U70_06010 [Bacteroidales bacterium]|nr:hypothetical protein [Bacteroidales bacterium]
MEKVPQIVKNAAKDLIEIYGDKFDYLGKYEGADVYVYQFPDGIVTGFPFVYLVKDDKVEEISEFLAVDIIGSFRVE